VAEGLDFHSSDVAVGSQAETQAKGTPKFDPNDIAQHCAFDWTPEPMYLNDPDTPVITWDEFEDDPNNPRDLSPLSEDARKALMDLDSIFSKTDVAPRRIEIEQAWKAYHYDRGYQFLLHHRNGGWTFPGTGTGYGAGHQKMMASLYHTNIYGEKKEIIVAALAREVPKVEFFPANPKHPPDQNMADVADDLKDIWAKNNNLQKLLQDAAGEFWNGDRVIFWTTFELNGEEYGFEDPEPPTVPEDEQNPPDKPIGDEASAEYEEANESPVNKGAKRRPRGRSVTRCLGKLDGKVPIYVDCQGKMGMISLCFDDDVAQSKARFCWMRDKIQGGGDGTGETELDRIARENVRQAVPGQYVTGDSLNRHAVRKHTYIRPSMFYDEMVTDEVREELLDKFPDGAVLVKSATEFCFARNEGMDDHIVVGHPFPGQGQNRRSLGESLLPIQDYINELIMLTLDFAKRTIAKKWMDNEAFNVEAVRSQKNIPGDIAPFQRQPGVAVDQLIFIEPTPTPQPYLVIFVQWLITSLSEQISGALPSLFGAPITGQVGSEGVAIQRDQALQRVGCPWNSLQSMFAQAARQAAMLTAKCANKDIDDVIPGRGNISIKLNNLKGAVLCYPESNPELPESWAQKENRITQLVDMALKSPDSPTGAMILDPTNLKEIRSALRLKGLVIKGESSVEKQEAELEVLLRSAPMPNPKKLKMTKLLQTAQMGMMQFGAKMQAGTLAPEEQQQMQQAPAMIQQLEQMANSLPDQISTVIVRDDGSQDNTIEADVCWKWMNSADGRKFANGTPEQQAAFANVHLHWTEETAAAKKIAQQNAPPPAPPKGSFNVPVDKLPAPEAAAAVQALGIPANPADFQQHAETQTNRDIQKKIIPDSVWAAEAPGSKPQ
jgi:hypothetical protein